MSDFLSRLKEFMINEEIREACGYYETILQSSESLKEMLADCNTYFPEFYYDSDTQEGYTNGKIKVFLYNETDDHELCGVSGRWESELDYHYTITLKYDERNWHYCDCTPSDVGYNPAYDCCGNGCDWSAPQIQVERIHNVTCQSFEGCESDLWKLEEKWNKCDDELKEKFKLQQVQSLEEQIKELEQRKKMLLRDKQN